MGFKTQAIRSVGELFDNKQARARIEKKGIIIESSAPSTPAQNGVSERAGGVITTRARAMRIGARLPDNLWPEIIAASVHLGNRTPSKAINYKTPFELARGWQPDLAYLCVYGCKAFCLTRRVQKNVDKKKKLEPKAHIGFLVGYVSTNIYRIWVPRLGKVMSMRDVKFNEEKVYSSKEIDAELTREELEATVESLKDKHESTDDDQVRDLNFFEPKPVHLRTDVQAPSVEGAEGGRGVMTPNVTATPRRLSDELKCGGFANQSDVKLSDDLSVIKPSGRLPPSADPRAVALEYIGVGSVPASVRKSSDVVLGRRLPTRAFLSGSQLWPLTLLE